MKLYFISILYFHMCGIYINVTVSYLSGAVQPSCWSVVLCWASLLQMWLFTIIYSCISVCLLWFLVSLSAHCQLGLVVCVCVCVWKGPASRCFSIHALFFPPDSPNHTARGGLRGQRGHKSMKSELDYKYVSTQNAPLNGYAVAMDTHYIMNSTAGEPIWCHPEQLVIGNGKSALSEKMDMDLLWVIPDLGPEGFITCEEWAANRSPSSRCRTWSWQIDELTLAQSWCLPGTCPKDY